VPAFEAAPKKTNVIPSEARNPLFLLSPPIPATNPLRCRLQNPRNRRYLPFPLLRLTLQLLSPRLRQRIILRPPVILRGPPRTLNQPRPLQPPKRRKQRPWIHRKHPMAQLLNPLRNSPPMQRLQRQRLQNQHVQSPLHQRCRSVRHRLSLLAAPGVPIRAFSRESREVYPTPLDCQEKPVGQTSVCPPSVRRSEDLEWCDSRLRWKASGDRTNVPDTPFRKLASAALDLLTSEEIDKLTACSNPECRWLFLDGSKNRGRRWCDMKLCGNRIKARRYRSRQRAAASQ
jgi:hypothetical protein